MLEQTKLNKLSVGINLNHFLLLTKIEIKTAKNGRDYLSLELRDDSLNLPAKMWDGFERLYNSVKEGDIVKVDGVIEEFQNQQQIKITRIRKAEISDNISFDDFLPKSARSLDDMKTELGTFVNSVKNTYLKQLLENILAGEKFDKYCRVPAGKSWHHSYVHGLLEHTLEIIKICDLLSTFHKEINRDILVAGAILHDFGKTEELTVETGFDYTDKGKFIGHIVIAAIYVEKEISKIEGFPEDLKNHLIHLILSHQGKLEYASPVEPKTLEAIVLYHADELSAKTNAYKNAILSEDPSKTSWTRYLPLAGTSLFVPPPAEDKIKESLFDI